MVNVTPVERDYQILDRNVVHLRANHEGDQLGRLVTGGCVCATEAIVDHWRPANPEKAARYDAFSAQLIAEERLATDYVDRLWNDYFDALDELSIPSSWMAL